MATQSLAPLVSILTEIHDCPCLNADRVQSVLAGAMLLLRRVESGLQRLYLLLLFVNYLREHRYNVHRTESFPILVCQQLGYLLGDEAGMLFLFVDFVVESRRLRSRTAVMALPGSGGGCFLVFPRRSIGPDVADCHMGATAHLQRET